MDGDINFVMLISFVIAVVAIIMLRRVLGRRTDEDEARIDRKMRAERARQDSANDTVVTLPPRQGAPNAGHSQDGPERDPIEERVDRFDVKDPEVRDGLIKVGTKDPSFDPEQFMAGAKQAYEMIVTAFAEGNRNMLKDLLSEDVFVGFNAAIDDREARGETIDQSFVGIHQATLKSARIEDREAVITIRFLSQLITATRDKDGEVISGDPDRVLEVTDIWTFARELNSPNPNWFLVATQATN